MKITVVAGFAAKRNMNVNACHEKMDKIGENLFNRLVLRN